MPYANPEDIAALADGAEARSAPKGGVRALMLAVLEEAIRDYLAPSHHVSARAESWVRDDEARSVFSFAHVCETLGLEPTSVRAALRHMRDAEVASRSIGRSRPNARNAARKIGS